MLNNLQLSEGDIEIETDPDNTNSDEDVILFIEYKYCTICHIE
jgi:hypothetical protein